MTRPARNSYCLFMTVLRLSLLSGMDSKSDWFVSSVLIVSTLLQVRIHMLWSESRVFRKIVRKLKTSGRTQMREDAKKSFRDKECDNDQLLARIYTMNSKGRHLAANRVYSHLLLWTMWTLDIFESTGHLDSFAFIDSDALTVLRLMVAIGALHVIGAIRAKRNFILCCILIISVPYALSLVYCQQIDFFLVAEEDKSISLVLYNILNFARLSVAFLGVILSIYPCVNDFLGRGTHISNISYTIENKSNLGNENLSQAKRLKEIRKHVEAIRHINPDSKNVLLIADSKFVSYSLSVYVEIIVTFILLSTNGVLTADLMQDRFPRLFLVEMVEFFGLSLQFVNDIVVEPTLLATLVDVADCDRTD